MAKAEKGDLLTELRKIDTPTITNVVATYPKNPLCLGLYNPWTENWYTDTSIRCIYPQMGPVVGNAVTCVYGLPDPNYSGRLSFMDVIDALDAMKNPNVSFKVCEIAMKNQKVEKSQLLPNVGTVPDGIGEIVAKQTHGWGYIKAVH